METKPIALIVEDNEDLNAIFSCTTSPLTPGMCKSNTIREGVSSASIFWAVVPSNAEVTA